MKISRLVALPLAALAVTVQAQSGQVMDDRMLTDKVKIALAREGVKTGDVHVETNRGRVLLSGFMQDNSEKRKALVVVSKVPGVVEVRDGMTLR